MTEHLPECEAYRDECGGGCICHHVRACEERVEESIDRAWEQAAQLAVAHARTATLDAAREAVRNECSHDTDSAWCVFVAAIDALREKP